MPEHTPAPTPSRGVYGFVMFLSFQLFFILYLIWALIPERYFFQIGITFLPERHWAITVPIYFLTVLTIFAFIIYPSLGFCMTPNVDDLRTIKDKYGIESKANSFRKWQKSDKNKCICVNKHNCYKDTYEKEVIKNENRFILDVKDLNIWDVSENLYSK